MPGAQAMLGGPVPEATPGAQIEGGGDCAYKVLAQMARAAAQGALLLHDDTAVRIVALRADHRDRVAAAQAQGVSTPTERTGMHTTALVVQVGEHTAMVSASRRRHAGAHRQGVLDTREAALAQPLALSEALASNEVAEESRLMRWHCLTPGWRQCSDLEEVFSHACQVVRAVLRQGFDHDAQAHEEQLGPEARVAYHQTQRQPLMDELTR